MTSGSSCNHINAIASVKHAKQHVCEECIKTGDSWVHLRTCQTCGITLCCDSSPNRHATRHAQASGHPGDCLGRAGGTLALLLSGRNHRRLLNSPHSQGIKQSAFRRTNRSTGNNDANILS